MSKTKKRSGSDMEDAEDEASSGGSDSGNDELEEFQEHNHGSKKPQNLAEAVYTFLTKTRYIAWTHPTTGQQYHIRALDWSDHKFDADSMEYSWPRAFACHESQPVHAAVWVPKSSSAGGGGKKTKKHSSDSSAVSLIGAWVFSPGGDETSNLYDKKFKKIFWDLCEEIESGVEPFSDETIEESFSVSSGDYAVRQFHCPSLEQLTLEDITGQKTPAMPASLQPQKSSGSKGGNPRCAAMRRLHYIPAKADGDSQLSEVAESAGIEIRKGSTTLFYELIKSESVSSTKQLVAWDKASSQLHVNADARNALNISTTQNVTLHPREGWQIWVQSTSHNRKVPAGSEALFHDLSYPTDGEDVADDNDDESEAADDSDDSESEEDEDEGAADDETEETEEFRTHKHESCKAKSLTAATRAFLEETKLFLLHSPSGAEYMLRAKVWKENEGFDDVHVKGFMWPRCFAGMESQAVNAAMWRRLKKASGKKGPLKLVAVWSYSGGGDETDMGYTKYLEEEFMDALTNDFDLGDANCQESISISSGADLLKNFHCPSLEAMTEKQIQRGVAGLATAAVAESRPIPSEDDPKIARIFVELRCQGFEPVICQEDATVEELAHKSGVLDYYRCFVEVLHPEKIEAHQAIEAWHNQKKVSLHFAYVRQKLRIPEGPATVAPHPEYTVWVEAKSKLRIVPAGTIASYQRPRLSEEREKAKQAADDAYHAQVKAQNAKRIPVLRCPSDVVAGGGLTGPVEMQLTAATSTSSSISVSTSVATVPAPIPASTVSAAVVSKSSGSTAASRPSELKDILAEKSFQLAKTEEDAQLVEIAAKAGIVWTVAYYEVLKKESVSADKKLVVVDSSTSSVFTDAEARKALKLPSSKVDITPKPGVRIWVQSTSRNRKIPKGSFVLFFNGCAF